jgi:hypothetical protein
MLPTSLNVRRLTMLLQRRTTRPLLDKGELVGMIQVDKQIVSQTSFFLPSRTYERLKHLSQPLFTPSLRMQMRHNIDLHIRHPKSPSSSLEIFEVDQRLAQTATSSPGNQLKRQLLDQQLKRVDRELSHTKSRRRRSWYDTQGRGNRPPCLTALHIEFAVRKISNSTNAIRQYRN